MLMLGSRTAPGTLHTLGVTLIYGVLAVYNSNGRGEIQKYVRHNK
jgi:hypothetical protein